MFSPRPAERGFTLIEIVVALAIFSVAAVALLNLAGGNTRTAAMLERRALAQVVADNLAVEAAIGGGEALTGGSGETEIGGRTLRWTRAAAPTPDGTLVRVDIDVREGDDPQVLASLSLFRRP
jgi:general secretion pathway protein I